MAIELGERFWSKVNKDASNGCWKWTGSKRGGGYGRFYVEGRSSYAHRVAYIDRHGDVPDAMEVDHACWNRLCVNPDHLRLLTKSGNQHNQSGLKSNNTSGYRGVSWSKANKHWIAHARINNKRTYVGTFKTAEEANEAIVAWRREHMPYSLMDVAA